MAVCPSPGAMLRCLYELAFGKQSSSNAKDQEIAKIAIEQISRQLEETPVQPRTITNSVSPAAERVPRPLTQDTSKKLSPVADLPAPIAALIADVAKKLSPETLSEIPNQKRTLKELRALIRHNQSDWEKNNKGPVTLDKAASEKKKQINRNLMVELLALQTEYRELFQEQQRATENRIKSLKHK